MAVCINHKNSKDCAWSNTKYYINYPNKEQYRACFLCQGKLNKGAYQLEQQNSEYSWKIYYQDKNSNNNKCKNLVATHLKCNELESIIQKETEIENLLDLKFWIKKEIAKLEAKISKYSDIRIQYQNYILPNKKLISAYQNRLEEFSSQTSSKNSKSKNLLGSKTWLKTEIPKLETKINKYSEIRTQYLKLVAPSQELINFYQNTLERLPNNIIRDPGPEPDIDLESKASLKKGIAWLQIKLKQYEDNGSSAYQTYITTVNNRLKLYQDILKNLNNSKNK